MTKAERLLKLIEASVKEFHLKKIPSNTIINHHNTISLWDNKLCVVYPGLKSDLNYETLEKHYDVYFVYNDKGKPLEKDRYNEKLVGKGITRQDKNKFVVYAPEMSTSVRYYHGELAKYAQRYWLKITVKDLDRDQTEKYVEQILIGKKKLIDVSDYTKVNQKNLKVALKCKSFDEVYKKLGDSKGNEVFNVFWDLHKYGDRHGNYKDVEDDKILNTVPGFFAVSKKGYIKFILER